MTWSALWPTTFARVADYRPMPPYWSGVARAALAAVALGGPVGYAVPAGPAGTHVAHEQPLFGADFYDRIHVSTRAIALGNVVSAQLREVWVWNAWRNSSQTLTSFVAAQAEGLTITSPGPPPLAFLPLQLRTWQVAIAPTGPPVIAATLTWTFANGVVLTTTVAGNRITAWSFRPDWKEGVRERFAWLTDVMTAVTGTEDRRALRQGPRRTLEFESLVHGRERQLLEATLFDWGARVWAVPLWMDKHVLTADLSIGTNEILLATADREYAPGQLAILLRDALRYEIIEVQQVLVDRLVLARPTLGAWPRGDTRLYPVQTMRLEQPATLRRWSTAGVRVRPRFQSVSAPAWTAALPATLYRGVPVLEQRPDVAEDPTAGYGRMLQELDGDTGQVFVDDVAGLGFPNQIHRWWLRSLAERAFFKRTLFGLRGRLNELWLPTWQDDLTLVASASAGAASIDVAWAGVTRFLRSQPNRRDLRIELTNGTVLYRRVGAPIEIDTDTERLSLDAAHGVELNPAQIRQISWLQRCRLDGDEIEVLYDNDVRGRAALMWRAIGHAA